ncbi:MAG: sugar ABC transporter substrate-binding protein [Pseudomonadota bacterium]
MPANRIPSGLPWILLIPIGLLVAGLGIFRPSPPVVGVVLKSWSNEYFLELLNGLQTTVQSELPHARLITRTPSNEGDVDGQIRVIQDLLDSGIDYLVVAPTDSQGLVPTLKEALDQGVYTVVVDTPLDEFTIGRWLGSNSGLPYIGSDNRAIGVSAAIEMCKALRGEAGKVIVLQGVPGQLTSDQRVSGFVSGMADCAGVEIIGRPIGNWRQHESYREVRAYKSHKLDGIYATNDLMALGAIQASLEFSDKIIIIGTDGGEASSQLLGKGLHATIAQDPWEIGAQAASQIFDHFERSISTLAPQYVDTTTVRSSTSQVSSERLTELNVTEVDYSRKAIDYWIQEFSTWFIDLEETVGVCFRGGLGLLLSLIFSKLIFRTLRIWKSNIDSKSESTARGEDVVRWVLFSDHLGTAFLGGLSLIITLLPMRELVTNEALERGIEIYLLVSIVMFLVINLIVSTDVHSSEHQIRRGGVGFVISTAIIINLSIFLSVGYLLTYAGNTGRSVF